MSVIAPGNLYTLLEMEYLTALERHTLRLHLRATEAVPTLAGNNYRYAVPNSGAGAEVSVRDTFDAFASHWAPYYAGDWHLVIRSLWGFDGTEWTPFDATPTTIGQLGTISMTQRPGNPTVRRILYLRSLLGARRRLWLAQTAVQHVAARTDVTPTGGGYDERDVELLAYLCGAQTAALAPDARPFAPLASVGSWWDRPRAFPWTSDALASIPF